MIKAILSILISFLFCSTIHAEQIVRLNKGIYTKDEMSLGIAAEAMWEKDYSKLETMAKMKMLFINESEKEINVIEKVQPQDAFAELPSTMIIFKFQDDYRKFYTLDDFIITIIR